MATRKSTQAAGASRGPRLSPRLRVYIGEQVAMGPGKAELLDAIAGEGSLAAAARRLEMSYMRAWRLMREMNELFRKPLVAVRPGVKGGARLTAEGERVLALYRGMEQAAEAATSALWRQLRSRLGSR